MKRFLFLLTSEEEINEIIRFSNLLEKKYPNIEKDIVYVKDVSKYEIFPLTIQGLGINSDTSLIASEYLNVENKKYLEYEKKLKGNFRKMYSITGNTVDSILEELKAYDLLVICRCGTISDNLNYLLKNHYKPLIVLSSENEKDYSLDNILMLNDGGYMVNSSVYQYFNIFGTKDIDVLRVNIEDKNRLTERFGSKCNVIDKNGDVEKIILSHLPSYDMVIMGVLKFSLIFERITGQVGIRILEKTTVPIFMG